MTARSVRTEDRAGAVTVVFRAWIGATALSGVPSTGWAVLRRRDPLAAARAAGTIAPGRAERPSVVVGAAVHVLVSAGWTVLLALVARIRRIGPVSGAAAGVAIAALDLGIARRRFPAIAALDQIPQWLDHVAFGAVVGWYLRRLGPEPA